MTVYVHKLRDIQ